MSAEYSKRVITDWIFWLGQLTDEQYQRLISLLQEELKNKGMFISNNRVLDTWNLVVYLNSHVWNIKTYIDLRSADKKD